ncbi:hypothetical protein GBAR_LOCUS10554 [Geodia barretti]|uniref:Uncharacterized protein n=1 Tax=Geodia barretti TaxID=519541 RepID=A0AA35RTD4_GEOBA|nr:hypothetical protein GBAR_LOCUS10554 [Geodia barretti]
MCSVVTRRKAVGGKESCLTLHNMSILASSGIIMKEQSSTMLLREEMWRQLRDSSPLLSISTPGLRM